MTILRPYKGAYWSEDKGMGEEDWFRSGLESVLKLEAVKEYRAAILQVSYIVLDSNKN